MAEYSIIKILNYKNNFVLNTKNLTRAQFKQQHVSIYSYLKSLNEQSRANGNTNFWQSS